MTKNENNAKYHLFLFRQGVPTDYIQSDRSRVEKEQFDALYKAGDETREGQNLYSVAE